MTKEERKLWFEFLRDHPVRFRRQEIIEDYIVDFYCDKAKLAIELDGSQHCEADAIQKDAARTRKIEKYGIVVLRFSNLDVQRQFEGVCAAIDAAVGARTAHPSAACGGSSPQGEP